MPTVNTYLFEGKERTISEIHAMVPAISKGTLRVWARNNALPTTRQAILTKPRHVTKPTSAQKALLSGVTRNVKRSE